VSGSLVDVDTAYAEERFDVEHRLNRPPSTPSPGTIATRRRAVTWAGRDPRLSGWRERVGRGVVGGFGLTMAITATVCAFSGARAAQVSRAEPAVLVTGVDDPITPVIADHLTGMVEQAEEDGHEALVVEMDTPGGLDTAMRDIVQAFLAARVPVVVYVTPSGARAASAGALIAWSSHVVAMAPGTTIGAATPVTLEGGEVGDKVVNDAAAYARAIAAARGRNVKVAAAAVTKGQALSDTEAVDEDVADLVVRNRAALLDALDGREMALPGGATVTLHTADAAVEEQGMSFLRKVLQRLADPTLAFLFMSIGTLGIIYELATPGIGAAGGIGALSVLIALFSLAVLPVNAVGFLFLVLAGVLFVAELFTPGVGVAAALGSVSLALAGIFLFPEDTPGLTLSLAAVLPMVAVVGVGVIVAGRLALRARGAPAVTGVRALVGRELVVARTAGRSGQAMVEGAWWNLRSRQPLQVGDRVQVRDVDGLDLVVDPVASDEKEGRP
jgi:membrane-bound serine protease (ClpP class)